MGIDLVALTAFLSPILPFLIKGGEEAAKEAGKKFGIDAWEKAKGVWGKLYPKIEAKEAAKEAVEDLAVAPEDQDLQTALRVQLKKILEKDQTLATKIAQLMREDSSSKTGGTQVQQKVDKNKGQVIGVVSGNQNKIVGQVKGNVNM